MIMDVSDGDRAFLSYAFSQPVLTEQEERDADVDLLILSHLKLVIRIAHGFKGYKLNFMDLVQAGTTGLITAARRFDPDNAAGARFATYAIWWIRAAITEFVLHNASLVKRGTNHRDKLLFFKASQIDDGTPEEVAERFGVSVEDVLLARQRRGHDYSLNTPINADNEEIEWQDNLADDTSSIEETIGDEQERNLQLAKINAALATLSERERTIVLGRQDGVSLETLSQQFGCSRERVRQVHRRAEEKIREECGVHVAVPPTATDKKRARQSKACRQCGVVKSLADFNPRARICMSCQETHRAAA